MTTDATVSPGAPTPEISRVGVIGCGVMGSGIAEVCLRAGLEVVDLEVDERAIDAGRRRVEASLSRAVERGRLGADQRDAAVGRLGFTTAVADLGGVDLVIEAAVESEAAKRPLFAELDERLGELAILASNTSSIPISRLTSAARRHPERVIGMHFFNPVPVLKLVEITPALLTSETTFDRAAAFATGVLGKKVIRSSDRAGFIVNALLVPYLIGAIRMFESGFATAEDIDTGMVEGCAHPTGPLALLDLIGLDTMLFIAESMFDEYKDPRYAPPQVLRRMVDAGWLGRKSGRGFFEYAG
jgi:3-hydroxybutyryl-CoA dehydrogenase